MSDITVMGYVELLPRAARIVRHIIETARVIRRLEPDVVVTIDAPGFANGIWRRLQDTGIPLVHYVAPTVWAWRAGRARRLAKRIDHLLTLLPFEPPYFEAEGLAASFVGHPALEGGADTADGAPIRDRYGLGPGPVVGVLPGSRSGEISRLLPVYRDAITRLAADRPGLSAVVPAVADHAAAIEAECASWPVPCAVVADRALRHAAMAACDVAVATSGTVTLELALARVPMVVGYRLNPLTAAVIRRLVRVKYATIVNLILDRPAIPELLLDQCRPESIAEALARLLDEPAARAAQLDAAREALVRLRPDGERPSERAASIILDIAGRPRGARTGRLQKGATP